MIQIQEKDEKAHFRHGLGPLGPYSGRQCFFFTKVWLCQSLNITVSCHVQHQKLMI